MSTSNQFLLLGLTIAATRLTALADPPPAAPALDPQDVSDAVASARITAAQEAQAESVLQSVKELKAAGRYAEAVEQLRDVLPLAPTLSLATLISASQALDAVLVRWEAALQLQQTRRQQARATEVHAAAATRAQQETQLREARRELATLERRLTETETARQTLERNQQEMRTLGADGRRFRLRQQAAALRTQVTVLKDRIETLEQQLAATLTPVPLPPVPADPSPWELYAVLRADFREALQEAKQREPNQP